MTGGGSGKRESEEVGFFLDVSVSVEDEYCPHVRWSAIRYSFPYCCLVSC